MGFLDDLRRAIERHPDLSQRKLGARIGITGSAISQFLSGHRPLPPDTFEAIIDALGLSGEERERLISRYATDYLVGEPKRALKRNLDATSRARRKWALAAKISDALLDLGRRLAEEPRPVAEAVRRAVLREIAGALAGAPGADRAWLVKAVEELDRGGNPSALEVYLTGLILRIGSNPGIGPRILQPVERLLSPEAMDRFVAAAKGQGDDSGGG